MKRLIFIIVFILLFSSTAFALRIVSLAPSVTEILYALGLGEEIAGVTTFCNYPPEAKKKPKIGGMSNPSLEAIVALRPDIVVMTTDGNPAWIEERLRALQIKTYVIRARRLPELAPEIRKIGEVLGISDRAERLASDIETEIERLKVNSRHKKESLMFVIWPEPLIVAGPGTLIDDAINLIGYENSAKEAGINYPKYSVEEAIRARPDVIVIGSAKGMEVASEGLLQRLKDTPALKNHRVYFAGDGLYRLGPRVIDGIKELKALTGSSK